MTEPEMCIARILYQNDETLFLEVRKQEGWVFPNGKTPEEIVKEFVPLIFADGKPWEDA